MQVAAESQLLLREALRLPQLLHVPAGHFELTSPAGEAFLSGMEIPATPKFVLSSTQKGSIGEALVGAQLMLASGGRLSPYRPLADDHGTDLLVTDKHSRGVMHIQVKASYGSKAHPPKTTQFDVQTTTFNASAGSYVLAAMIDIVDGALWRAWLIPSTELRAISIASAAKLAITPNPSLDSRDRYTPWRCRDMQEVVERLLRPA